MLPPRTYRAGHSLEDFCRVCKTDRMHTVIVVDEGGTPIRVACGYCKSEHKYRGPNVRLGSAPLPIVSDRERTATPMKVSNDTSGDLELLLRRIIREEAGITSAVPADKWRGGTLVLRPGTAGLQEKSWPIETFFHKIVMLRNRLRTLEQHVNASDLPDDVKVKLQTYVTGCYGSLTSFNILFAAEEDQFKGSGE